MNSLQRARTNIDSAHNNPGRRKDAVTKGINAWE
jgi:hypothetical protein